VPGFSDRAGSRFGLGLKFVKVFPADFVPAYTIFLTIFRTTIFLVRKVDFVVLTAVTSVSEVIVTFLQLILKLRTRLCAFALCSD